MNKSIFIIFLFLLFPQFVFAENYNGEWFFESNNKKCSSFFKWDNTKIIIKDNKATYNISNTNGWSHKYIGKLKKNKKIHMNGIDASISGKFTSNDQLEIKFTNIRETWEWVNMLSKCTATFTNKKNDTSFKWESSKNANEIVFNEDYDNPKITCTDKDGNVYSRNKNIYKTCDELFEKISNIENDEVKESRICMRKNGEFYIIPLEAGCGFNKELTLEEYQQLIGQNIDNSNTIEPISRPNF